MIVLVVKGNLTMLVEDYMDLVDLVDLVLDNSPSAQVVHPVPAIQCLVLSEELVLEKQKSAVTLPHALCPNCLSAFY